MAASIPVTMEAFVCVSIDHRPPHPIRGSASLFQGVTEATAPVLRSSRSSWSPLASHSPSEASPTRYVPGYACWTLPVPTFSRYVVALAQQVWPHVLNEVGQDEIHRLPVATMVRRTPELKAWPPNTVPTAPVVGSTAMPPVTSREEHDRSVVGELCAVGDEDRDRQVDEPDRLRRAGRPASAWRAAWVALVAVAMVALGVGVGPGPEVTTPATSTAIAKIPTAAAPRAFATNLELRPLVRRLRAAFSRR